jgi:spermidine synthase
MKFSKLTSIRRSSTTEIFRDYGLVEDFPQRWSYHPGAIELEDEDDKWLYAPEQITFSLELTGEQVDDDEESFKKQTGGGIEVVWSDHLLFDNRGRNYVRRIFRRELRRLYRFQNVRFELNRTESLMKEIPQAEWNSIKKYYYSIVRALKRAIHSLVNGDNEASQMHGPSSIASVCRNNTSSNEGYCPADDVDSNSVHYDDLKDEEDSLNYIFPNCPTTQLVEFYEYEDLEVFQTNYQKLTFVTRGRDRDLCLNIENTLQICSNYRPHYHEFFVHFPARYLKKIERVIFIGGGDSMLLHEVLKYPDLQKVVGLELDQQVTRKSFKYFNSQPHFDNDRVEWWYGDATKSLPLLPKEYWGSFDLVLVDLSETVMSMTVTGKLDIFSALSLLLKPEGIMVKNEPYIDQFSDFFDHTIQLFYGSPKICTQVLVMGSNEVDFLHSPVQNHEIVQTLLFEPMRNAPDRHKFLHDYRKNNANEQGKCDDHSTQAEEEVMHGRKAGLVEIVDLDGVSGAQFDTALLESKLHVALKSEGFVPISAVKAGDSERGSDILIVLKEGFVVVRPWPVYNYCALDIQLWGAFSKLSTIRSKLVEAIAGIRGSEDSSVTVSSYRIVTGGMFGAQTWEVDKGTIGIQMRQTRNCENPDPVAEKDGSASQDENVLTQIALETALSQAADLLPGTNLVVVVACGLGNDEESCPSVRALSEHPKVGRVIPIWACPEVVRIGSDERGDDDVHSEMYQCETALVSKFDDIFGDEEDDEDGSLLNLDMFVLDPSVPYSMAQIYSSILGFFPHRDDWMAPEHVLLAPNPLYPHDAAMRDAADNENHDDDVGVMSEPTESSWRRNFLERYRKDYHRVPLFRAELMVRKRTEGGSSSSSASSIPWMEVGLLSSKDRHFFHNLTAMESSFQRALDRSAPSLTVTIESVTGGLHYYDTDHAGEVTLDNRMYYPETYDKASALEQFQTQRPLARHSIFQFEWSPPTPDEDSSEVATPPTAMPTWKELEETLLLSMAAAQYTPITLERFDDEGLIGDGALLAVPFTSSSLPSHDEEGGGSPQESQHHNMAIVIWDGRVQVDVHLFSSSNMEVAVADTFADTFGQLSRMALRLRDDQPRGYGRVVNFETDIVSVMGGGAVDDAADDHTTIATEL